LNIIHITDTHILDRAVDQLHGIQTQKTLAKVLLNCRAQYPETDLIVLTGDVSQTGTYDSYSVFEATIHNLKQSIYCVPGNHDTPALLKKVVTHCPVDSANVFDMGPFLLILLNSWVESEEHGALTEHCINQLKDYVTGNKEKVFVVAIHHPPVSIHSDWLDKISLRNPTEFLRVLQGPRAPKSLILFGHVHQEVDQKLDNLRLLGTPSTCYQFEPFSQFMKISYKRPPAYRFIRLDAAGHVDTKVHFVN